MAVLTITAHRDAGSGRTTVRVGLGSDPDAMPHEHEAHHRRLAAALLPGRTCSGSDRRGSRSSGERRRGACPVRAGLTTNSRGSATILGVIWSDTSRPCGTALSIGG